MGENKTKRADNSNKKNSRCLGAVDLEVVLHHVRQEVVRVGKLPENRLTLGRRLHLKDYII